MAGRASRPSLRSIAGVALMVLVHSGCALLSRVETVGRGQEGGRPIASCTTFQVGTPDSGPPTMLDQEGAAEALLARMVALGVPEATLDVVPPDRIVLGLPAGDEASWRAVASRPGVLSFVAVPAEFDAMVVDGEPVPEGMDATPILTSEDIGSAGAMVDDHGQPALAVTFTTDGAAAFEEWAADNVGRRFAVVVDGIVLTAPVIREAHFGGQAQISGNFTTDEVAALAAAIGSGALPVPLTELSVADALDGSCAAPEAVP